MGYVKHEMFALASTDVGRPEARRRIIAAYQANACHLGKTAKSFDDASRDALTRWVAMIPGLAEELEAIKLRAIKEGWHHDMNTKSPGRPRTKRAGRRRA